MSAKQAQITLERVSEVPETASVRHFDEIDDQLQEVVSPVSHRERSTVTVDPFRAALLDECDCEIVKLTDYYRISRV